MTNTYSISLYPLSSFPFHTSSLLRPHPSHPLPTTSSLPCLVPSGHDLELTHVCTHPTQQLVVTSSQDTTFRSVLCLCIYTLVS